MEWTREQRQAIENDGGNVLVSASAGSGKTAVMIERVIRLAVRRGIPVDRILAVTFASDAAEEMQTRLYQALGEEIRKPDADKRFLAKQMELLSMGSICTFHSFCLDVLRTYFYKIDLDPGFKVASPEDTDGIMSTVLDELIRDSIEQGDEEFIELTEIFASGRSDRVLREEILAAYHFATAEADPVDFFQNAFLRLYREHGLIFSEIVALTKSRLLGYRQKAEKTRDAALSCNLVKTARICEGISQMLAAAETAETYEEMKRALSGFPAGQRKDSVKDLGEIERVVTAEFDALKAGVKGAVDLLNKSLLVYSEEEIETARESGLRYLKKFSSVCLDFMRRFSEYKRKKNLVDFSDFEHFALEILKFEEIRKALQDKYEYIFVDEYQDTSRIQEEILSAITSGNNLFMVGDLKQSIYRFRRCEPRIFRRKYKLYTQGGGTAIHLNRNFRSRKGILAFTDALMGKVMTERLGGTDYALSDRMTSGEEPIDCAEIILSEEKNQMPPPQPGVYDLCEDTGRENTAFQAEAEIIAECIERALAMKIFDPRTQRERKVKLSDIVILSRNLKNYTDGVRGVLENEYGIPIVSSGDEAAGIEVNLLIDLLSVMDSPKQDLPLLAVMRSVFGGFTDEELAQIKLAYRASGGSGKFFYDAAEYVRDDVHAALHEKVLHFYESMDRYRKISTFQKLSYVLSLAVSECGYDRYLLSQKYGREKYLKASAFLAKIDAGSYACDLSGFLKGISDGRIKISIAGISAGENVRLMSIHKSKGLEFPIVILMGTGERFNLISKSVIEIGTDYGGATDHFNVRERIRKPSVFKEFLRIRERKNLIEDELRLLYVAVTRAQNYLFLTGRKKSAQEKIDDLYAATSYLDFLSAGMKDRIQIHVGGEASNIREQDDVPQAEPKRGLVKEIKKLLTFRYPYESHAAAVSQKYTVSSLLRSENQTRQAAVPVLFEEKARLGTAYHAIMEQCDISAPSRENVASVCSRLKSLGIVEENAQIDIALILECLQSPLMRELSQRKIYREKEFMLRVSPSEIGVEGDEPVLVQGKIDLIAVGGGEAVVVDFKSGKIGGAEQAVRKYQRQLDLYALAVRKILNLPVKHKIIYAIEEKAAYYCD